jgi:hypothetical protein
MSDYSKRYAGTLDYLFQYWEHIFNASGISESWPLGSGVPGRFPSPQQVFFTKFNFII